MLEAESPMNKESIFLKYQRILSYFLIPITIGFLLLRVIHLNADFPAGITPSGTLYTDEGWYASAALRHYLYSNWYLPDDFNAAVNMPVGQILHRLSFAVFGNSFVAARGMVVASFIALTTLMTGLVYRRWGGTAAILTALLLATNYLVFAYSRLALMDLLATFFVVCGLFIALRTKGDKRLLGLIFCAALFGLGILTKASVAFAVPLLFYLAWRYGKHNRERLVLAISSTLVVVALVGSYIVIAKLFFAEDYSYFSAINFSAERSHGSLGGWLRHLPRTLLRSHVFGTGLVGLTALMTAGAAIVSRRFRHDPLVHVLVLYAALYLASISVIAYGPPRYYLPLAIPLTGLCAIACIALKTWILEKSRWPSAAILAVTPIVLVIVITLGESAKIITYMANPSFSYHIMAQGVEDIIRDREGEVEGVVVFGHIVDWVAVETGIRAVNTILTTGNLATQLRSYQPEYLLVHTDEDVIDAAEAEGGRVEELQSWDVFANYYAEGQPVRLMHVDWN